MEKIKAVLGILEEKSYFWDELYGDELEQCITMLKDGIAELQQPLKFTITMAPGHEPIIFGVHRVEGN